MRHMAPTVSYLHLLLGELLQRRGHNVDIGTLWVKDKRVLEHEIHVTQEFGLVRNHLWAQGNKLT